ncbi:urea ABC transporter permease subunit UrtB [Pseudoduganella ginsengisoli]|uniref:Urea ABC transporter permease subunit UrtB n=1 Tax=Pseudoduganella ginsengisoli TaxID=1462440 RepID=A0A6L6PV59_9BURK|nr:urea ABC transporter permease subunit UrtB [Pseudoduganella ginsengisoli]MTW00878.1 urea ABC transporter permease subunit UrtB [Pseudoduganella ginsengisoli]
MKTWRYLLCSAALVLQGSVGPVAYAAVAPAALQALAGDDPDARVQAVSDIAAQADADAARVLQALKNETLYATPDGKVFVAEGGSTLDASTGKAVAAPAGLDGIVVNNRLRGAVDAALSGLALLSPQRNERLAAARALQGTEPDAAQSTLLRKAAKVETDGEIAVLLQQLLAVADLHAPEAGTRKQAVTALAGSMDPNVRRILQAMVARGPGSDAGSDAGSGDPDPGVRAAAKAALDTIDSRAARTEFVGNLFYGISLGSVLLLAALGLAITFGLMGIINMAHGELLMIGAYTTYGCQALFRHYLPGAVDWYLAAALPASFIVAALAGMALERTVIRWLYGRPLETLLATWGISLMLMQLVRTLFGAQNVEVANPAWMSGGVTVLGTLVLPYNRIAIIAFACIVVAAVWLVLTRTRLGLFVRAVMQNRRMADCVGVPTGRIDMMTFGLGSGIAGLGGAALSQLGNVGPDLGQAYIIDSFMVVVLGGVGQLAGTVIAALGLGEVNKLLEPVAGAVLAKIAILVFIIVFIQRRPQGLFALKGRSVE